MKRVLLRDGKAVTEAGGRLFRNAPVRNEPSMSVAPSTSGQDKSCVAKKLCYEVLDGAIAQQVTSGLILPVVPISSQTKNALLAELQCQVTRSPGSERFPVRQKEKRVNFMVKRVSPRVLFWRQSSGSTKTVRHRRPA